MENSINLLLLVGGTPAIEWLKFEIIRKILKDECINNIWQLIHLLHELITINGRHKMLWEFHWLPSGRMFLDIILISAECWFLEVYDWCDFFLANLHQIKMIYWKWYQLLCIEAKRANIWFSQMKSLQLNTFSTPKHVLITHLYKYVFRMLFCLVWNPLTNNNPCISVSHWGIMNSK